MLTATEAALRLGVHERTIRRAIDRGDLSAIKAGGHFRISLADLLDFDSERRGDNTPSPHERGQPDRQGNEQDAASLRMLGDSDFLTPSPVPTPADPMIGRDDEVVLLGELLRRPGVRLVTITGPGGVGKTRLATATATALARSFTDGVSFIPLATVSDPGQILSAIARALGLREAGDRALEDGLGPALRQREMLLVLDNFEQVVDGAPALSRLIAICPDLTLLVTSRELLRIGGEHRFPLTPLPAPQPAAIDSLAELEQSPSVALLVERAQRVRPGFHLTTENAAAVRDISTRLDGLPLAIELAAAWFGALSPEALATRLDLRLPLLTGGNRDLPDRQRTMRDTIAWSYDLLDEAEQRCFRRLGVFVGGGTLTAAEQVNGATPNSETRPPMHLVAALVEKSLLSQEVDAGGEPRYTMLETVREFARERLTAAGELAVAQEAHAAWCLDFARRAGDRAMEHDQAHWLERIESDHDNLRAAMSWAEESRDAATLLGIGEALWMFWYIRGHVAEGLRWLDAGLTLGEDLPSVTRINVLIGAGQLAHYNGDSARATSYLERSLAHCRALAYADGMALTLLELGIVAEDHGDYERASNYLEEARRIAVAEGDLLRVVMTMYHLAVVAYGQDDLSHADALCGDALAIARQRSHAFGIAAVQTHRGLVLSDLGDIAGALVALDEAVGLYAASKDLEGIARCLANYAVVATAGRHGVTAARLIGAGESLQELLGYGFHYPEGPRYQRAAQATRAALGDAYASLVAEGKALTIDEALEVAATLSTLPFGAEEAEATPRPFGLTARELEILQLLAAGQSDREIAEALFISRHTVMRHVANVLTKLNVSSRTAAATLAVRSGLA